MADHSLFVSFEGIDFSGKSTQCTRLVRWLQQQKISHFLVREPGGTTISEKVRDILLSTSHMSMDAITEMLLFSAARSQVVVEEILPALKRGELVIADRFHDSTTAYQGFGRGISLDAIAHVHQLATHNLFPDVTFYFDIDYQETLRRRERVMRVIDRMEESDSEFFERVRLGYVSIAAREPDRFVIIDGRQNELAIEAMIQRTIRDRWERKVAQ